MNETGALPEPRPSGLASPRPPFRWVRRRSVLTAPDTQVYLWHHTVNDRSCAPSQARSHT